MNTKNILIRNFVVMVIGLVSLAACGGGGGGGNNDSPPPPPTSTTCIWDSSSWDGCTFDS